VGMGAYTLSDRATWLAFANPGDHRILVEGDPRLLNTYALVQVDPTHCPNVNAIAAAELIGWLLSADGQAAITSHRVGDAQVFFPIPPTSR
ncbi:MAG: sulfate transporter, partial [Pseudomonadota bacterium]